MKRHHSISSSWDIAIRNLSNSKPSNGRPIRRQSKPLSERDLIDGVQRVGKRIGTDIFRIICQEAFIAPGQSPNGLARIGQLITHRETENAAKATVEIERSMLRYFAVFLADPVIRHSILDAAFRARQSKNRRSNDLSASAILARYANEYPGDSKTALIERMLNEGVIVEAYGKYEVSETGKSLPKSLDSAISRARKNLRNR